MNNQMTHDRKKLLPSTPSKVYNASNPGFKTRFTYIPVACGVLDAQFLFYVDLICGSRGLESHSY